MSRSMAVPVIFMLALLLGFQNCGDFASFGQVSSAKTDPAAEQQTGAGDSETSPDSDPGYDIFVIAGQSNSVGYGGGNYSDPNSTPALNSRIFQIGRFAGNDLRVIAANDRLDHWVSHDANGNPTAGIGMGAAFARLYAKEKLEGERKILLVPAGYGGTLSLQWDREIDSLPAEPNFHDSLMLTDDLVQRLKIALAQPGGTNRFKGLLWHQGESDVDCLEPGIWCNGKTPNGAAYAARIHDIFDFIRGQVPYAVPVMLGKLVPVWDGGARPGAMNRKTEIENAIVDLAHSNKNTAVVETAGLLANSQAGIGSTDNIHFAAQSQIDLGGRYYEAFKSITEAGN